MSKRYGMSRTAAVRSLLRINPLESVQAVIAVLAFLLVPVVGIVLAPHWAPTESATAIRIIAGALMVLALYFTALIPLLCPDWGTRAGGAVASLIITFLAAGMFTIAAPAQVANVAVVYALIGSALGSIAGALTPRGDFWMELLDTVRYGY